MQLESGTRDVDVEHILGDVEDHSFREELRSCQHFLVDSELEKARHEVFNYAVEFLNETIVNEKFDHLLNNFLNKTDVVESCSQERMNTKWKFYKLTNLTVFAALLKDVPMGCKNAVLPEPLLKNCTINCLTYEENMKHETTI